MNTQGKILSRGTLLERLVDHRRRGERIVLANGCFDLLHVGHIRYLAAARQEGEILVVAVNSDASVRQLKDDGRPILPARARAELVAGLVSVNYVILFDETDVGELLRELRPDVHVKGTDYTRETVPEREVARQLGIRIAIVGDSKQHSTRDLLERVRRRADG